MPESRGLGMCIRDRRERQRQADRQTERDRQIRTDRQTDRQRVSSAVQNSATIASVPQTAGSHHRGENPAIVFNPPNLCKRVNRSTQWRAGPKGSSPGCPAEKRPPESPAARSQRVNINTRRVNPFRIGVSPSSPTPLSAQYDSLPITFHIPLEMRRTKVNLGLKVRGVGLQVRTLTAEMKFRAHMNEHANA